MKRTIALKLHTNDEQNTALVTLQREFTKVCTEVATLARSYGCWNKVKLQRLAYYSLRSSTVLGSQAVLKAIAAVCNAYRSLRAKKENDMSSLNFKSQGSVHFDKRLYSLKENAMLSLKTLSGRILVPMILGEFQLDYLNRGKPKEGELVYERDSWYFKLVLDLPDVEPLILLSSSNACHTILGIDLGENVIAATSSGKMYGGNYLRHIRDCFLALRKRLQTNGSKSAKQLLRKISGKEARYMTHLNHVLSKALVQEALDQGCGIIALEKLTNIGKRIKAHKRMRTRLHRWAWAQLQAFIEYKAKAAGLLVVYVNPAYSSQTCSHCGNLGIRNKHRFSCNNCGILQHSDTNASRNLCKIAASADVVTGTVNCPHVAAP